MSDALGPCAPAGRRSDCRTPVSGIVLAALIGFIPPALTVAYFVGAYSQQIKGNTEDIDDLEMAMAQFPATFPPIEITRRLDRFDFRLTNLENGVEVVKRALGVESERQ